MLDFNGGVVTRQFAAGWAPIGAIQTGNGYEVAWGDVARSEYTVWNVDSNGNYTNSATGILSGTSPTQLELAGMEAAFGESFATGVRRRRRPRLRPTPQRPWMSSR